MKSQILSLSSKEEIISKFGVNFLIKNNKVYLSKKNYQILIENDANFFKEIIKTCKKTEFPNLNIPYPATEIDWKLIKERIRSVTLNITSRCNSDCAMCFQNETFPFQEMSIENIKYILSKIGKNKQVVLFGGEPTVREDLFEIIKLIKESGNTPIIYTNGLKLADPDYVRKLKENGCNKVHISFDGFRENIYEQLRGDGKQLCIKLKALKNMEKYNMKIFLSSVIVSGINEDEVPKLLDFSIKNNHFIQSLTLFGATPYGKFNIKIEKFLTSSDLIELLEKTSNSVINKEYFIEFKKLRVNLYNILKKVGIYFPFGNYASLTLFKVEEKQVKHLIPLEELKEINRRIENKEISIMKYLFTKNSLLLLKLLWNKLKPEALGNTLGIHVANIITPINYFPIEIDNRRIAKVKDEYLIFLQSV